ncbi:hypothetical protein RND81_01G208600 [Saponaria officinalis]|uniref:RRM domain-containing protein n=1 Tax=Saponaria officinalis TaxID=3572 RepID=A0AAW1NHC8_SAPOF
MSQQRQEFHHRMNDTTYTKLFVGGLAWETQRETMKKYFEQFGEILEAVVITDKSSGRSKGYGFVTFKEPEAAFRACQNPSPVIDGRRANCNLAAFGVQKNTPTPTTPQHVAGGGRFRGGSPGLMTAPTYHGSTSHFHQPNTQPPFPYSPYGYTGYPHDTMYQMNYYGAYGQQYAPYYPTGGTGGAGAGAGAGAGGYIQNYYPAYYGTYGQSSQGHHGFGVQYPSHQMVQQFPYLPQHHFTSTTPILSLPPPSMSLPTSTGVTTTVGVLGATLTSPSQVSSGLLTSEQNSTT